MGVYGDHLKGHLVFHLLTEWGEAIDAARERDDVPAEDVESLERMRTVLTFFGKRLDRADSYLLRARFAEQFVNPLTVVRDRVRSYAAEGKPDYLKEANDTVDGVFDALATFPIPLAPEDIKGLREAADAYRGAMSQGLQKLQEQAAARTTELAALATEINGLKKAVADELQRTAAIGTEQQGNFVTAQTAREQAHETEQAAWKQRSDTLITGLQESFSQAQEARNQTHNAAEQERQKRFDALLADQTTTLADRKIEFEREDADLVKGNAEAMESLRYAYERQGKNILDEIRNHKVNVEKLVGVIGELGVTSGHKKQADSARRQVWVWQTITVGALGFFIYFAYEAAAAAQKTSQAQPPMVTTAQAPNAQAPTAVSEQRFNWSALAGRIYFSLATGLLAAFGASQVARYQQVESRNRKLELDLQALGPFLESLPDEKRVELREKIADRSFGRDDTQVIAAGPTNLGDLLSAKQAEQMIELLTKFLDAARKAKE